MFGLVLFEYQRLYGDYFYSRRHWCQARIVNVFEREGCYKCPLLNGRHICYIFSAYEICEWAIQLLMCRSSRHHKDDGLEYALEVLDMSWCDGDTGDEESMLEKRKALPSLIRKCSV